jgi:YidC/Oxa1 family membrane protein insertase
MILDSFLEFLLNNLFAISKNYGVSIILLSLVVNIIMLPLYWIGEILQNKESKRQSAMREDLQSINKIKNKQEKYYYTKEIYKRNNYKSYYSLIGILGLIVQIPFFIAAYSMLLQFDQIQGVSFGPIKDLASPDAIFSLGDYRLNILPFLMTFINFIGIALQYKYAKNKQEVIKLASIALIFLVLLYDIASALLLYWTINNIFSVVKTLVIRNQHVRNLLNQFSFKNRLSRTFYGIRFPLIRDGSSRTYFVIIAINISLWFMLPLYLFGIYGDEFYAVDIFYHVNLLIVLTISSTICFLVFNKLVFIAIERFISANYKELYHRVFYGILIFIFSWISFAGYVFPIIKSTGGLIDNNHLNLPLDWNNITFVVILSFVSAWLATYKNRHSLIAFFFCVFYLSSLPSLISNLSMLHEKTEILKTNGQDIYISELSSKKNILVVSFDGLQRSSVLDIFNTDAEIKAQFSDFTFFTNAVSTAPATFMSLGSELFGNINFRAFGQTKNELKANLPFSDLLINKIQNDSVNISLYGAYTVFSTKPENHYIISDPAESKVQFFNVFHYEFDRLLSGKIGFRLIRRIIANIINPILVNLNLLSSSNYNDDIEIKEYARWVDHLNITERDTLSLKYLHFLHTHFPVRLDRNGVVRSDNKRWMELNQNEKGSYNQTYFALTQFVDLINKLKEIGAYDNSLIIFKSDHGQPTSYYDSYPLNLKINNHQRWGYSRYEPLLMIKDLSRRVNVITEVSDLVTLADLSSTIDAEVYNKGVVSDFSKGLNLLDTIDISKSPLIYMDFVEDSTSNFKFDSHKTHMLDRTKSNTLIDLLRLSGVELSNDSIERIDPILIK